MEPTDTTTAAMENTESTSFNYHEEVVSPPPKQQKQPYRKRHGARNQHRHKFFVQWVLDTFPIPPNHDKHFVLDVAGGKGEVAVRLAMCHRQQVILVDPRPAPLVSCFQSTVLPKLPKKWQERIRQRPEGFVEEKIQERITQLEMRLDPDNDEDEYATTTTTTTTRPLELQQAIHQATVLLGLHADAATEAIVDVALKYNKPFVVVPCCVFPNLFRKRQVWEGGKWVPVRSYDQFCEYLLKKDERLRETILPFEGRNRAIWWDGQSDTTTNGSGTGTCTQEDNDDKNRNDVN
eukprot:Nitzschia sp. Nitz4//scaffold20_size174350//74892//75767//NITZ4_002099-RA/size174350-processed-gene-0.310-mRNA-1//-1//CDS//3329541800//3789//frame0